MDEPRTYSIGVRLRRTVLESAFVSVPITEEVMQPEADAQGRRRLDAEKVMAAAVRLGLEPSTRWEPESAPLVEFHPVQTPPPPSGR